MNNFFEPLEKIDGEIITTLEKFTNRFQAWTGYDNFWVAGKLIIVFFIIACIEAKAKYELQDQYVKIVIEGLFSLYLNYKLIKWSKIYTDWSKNRYGINKNPLGNPNTIRLFISIVLMAVGHLNTVKISSIFVKSLMLSEDVIIILIIYLISCTPLPPCRGSLWEKAKPVLADNI